MTPEDAAKLIDDLAEQLTLAKWRAFPKYAADQMGAGNCLTCGLKIDGSSSRGCHPSCYRKIKRDIEAGTYSEGMAIAIGVLSPEQKSGRKVEASGRRAKLIASSTAEKLSAAKSIIIAKDMAKTDQTDEIDELARDTKGTIVGRRKSKATPKTSEAKNRSKGRRTG